MEVGGKDPQVAEECCDASLSAPAEGEESANSRVEPLVPMPSTTSVAVSTPSDVTTTTVNGARQPEAKLEERRTALGKRARKTSYKLLDDADMPMVRKLLGFFLQFSSKKLAV